MTVHSVKITEAIDGSGNHLVVSDENGGCIFVDRISEAGLESLQQAAADLVFGSQEEQYLNASGDPRSPEYGQNLLDAASEHARELYRRGNQIGRGDL